MKIDLLFDPFGASWHDIQEGAIAAEGEGFDGVWLYDHLAGSVHGQQRVLECWTTLTAIAATVPRIALGPMVLNVANRDPGTLAVMAATLQEVSAGRLLLGLGAGGGRETPYAAEQYALGRSVPGDSTSLAPALTSISIHRAASTRRMWPCANAIASPPAPFIRSITRSARTATSEGETTVPAGAELSTVATAPTAKPRSASAAAASSCVLPASAGTPRNA